VIGQMVAVLVVLGGLMCLLWLLRRKGMAQVRLPGRRRNGPKQLEVLERLPLTATHSVHLVRAADTVLLIGVSPSSCQTLSTLPSSVQARRTPEGVLTWDGS